MSGGSHAQRGFKIQGLICTLESIKDEDFEWRKVEMEPEEDKIDIKWIGESEDEYLSIAQVKSTINEFSWKDILTWFENLVKGNSSNKYILYLVGHCKKEDRELIETFNKGNYDISQENGLVNLKANISKCTIVTKSLDYNGFKDSIYVELHKLYYEHEMKHVPPIELEKITGAIIEHFDSMPILKSLRSRDEIIPLLIKWCKEEIGMHQQLISTIQLRERLILFRDTIESRVNNATFPYQNYENSSTVYEEFGDIFDKFEELSNEYKKIHSVLMQIDGIAILYRTSFADTSMIKEQKDIYLNKLELSVQDLINKKVDTFIKLINNIILDL